MRSGLLSPSPQYDEVTEVVAEDDLPTLVKSLKDVNNVLRNALAALSEEHKRVCVEYAASLELKAKVASDPVPVEWSELCDIVRVLTQKLDECQRNCVILQEQLDQSQSDCRQWQTSYNEMKSQNDRLSHELMCLVQLKHTNPSVTTAPSAACGLQTTEYEQVQDMVDAVGGADRIYASLQQLKLSEVEKKLHCSLYETEQRALSTIERSRLLNEKVRREASHV